MTPSASSPPKETSKPASAEPSLACCAPNRRQFLQLAGATLAGAAASDNAAAEPLAAANGESAIPADKNLAPDWVKSLFERGDPTVYRGEELQKIGMPVGGLCCGLVYLGGDGTLWKLDIFNDVYNSGTSGPNYAAPLVPSSPFAQGFAVRVKWGERTESRRLDRRGFSDIEFVGQYPVGTVRYREAESPLEVMLQAASPFIPLNLEDSSLPVTLLRYELRNRGPDELTVDLVGWLENAVGLRSAKPGQGTRRNEITRQPGWTAVTCRLVPLPPPVPRQPRPAVVFEDFERETYGDWEVTGSAFGAGPVESANMPAYQGDVGSRGQRLVNSHHTRGGEDVAQGDAHLGTLTSRPFVIERDYIAFLIGGGAHARKTCLNLLVDGEVVDSATGTNDNRMQRRQFDVRGVQGRGARLQLVDNEPGPWGNVGLDEIVFTDTPVLPEQPLESQPDFGTMALVLLDGPGQSAFWPGVAATQALPAEIFAHSPAKSEVAEAPVGEPLVAAAARTLQLAPGQAEQVTFAITWHFPRVSLGVPDQDGGRHYVRRFADATAVAQYVAEQRERLLEQTLLWRDTWYDSTLPYWFLDRTFANTSTLATTTCHLFASGRFYGWEGIGCCPGTCTHVWHYAHAPARLFPALERSLRELVDFGLAMDQQSGSIRFRGEFNNDPAIDGQSGTVLRAYREHQMSADDAFLRRNWPAIRKALQFLIDQDGNADGIIEGKQHNTLDTDWYGPVAWLSSLYLAALRAGAAMAGEAGDVDFQRRAAAIADRGARRLVEVCWNGEYFIHRRDPRHEDSMGSTTGCEIDQVFGQSWAYQVGLGRILSETHVQSALRALWTYNFTPDVGPFRAANQSGRWYAMPGEGGLVMCTWPKGDAAGAGGQAPAWAVGYFNECMSGFEHQVAGHMLWESMTLEGLAVERMIHDRYHAARRNPWNEIECGDHYARAMASYGVFLAASGYRYHGPQGCLAFAPRVRPEDFRAAFTTAEGWGTYSQRQSPDGQAHAIQVRWGQLRLSKFACQVPGDQVVHTAKVMLRGQPWSVRFVQSGREVELSLSPAAVIGTGETLEVELT